MEQLGIDVARNSRGRRIPGGRVVSTFCLAASSTSDKPEFGGDGACFLKGEPLMNRGHQAQVSERNANDRSGARLERTCKVRNGHRFIQDNLSDDRCAPASPVIMHTVDPPPHAAMEHDNTATKKPVGHAFRPDSFALAPAPVVTS
jgi:hypothetical protein